MSVLHLWRLLPFSLLAALVWMVPVGPAQAQGQVGTTLELLLPLESAVGQETELSARLTTELGRGVVGVEVLFLREVAFMNAGNDLVLGTALTGEGGVATLLFVPRSEGEMVIAGQFDGNSQYGAAFASGTVPIATGPALYTVDAGVKVPGVNVSLLVAILGGVWSIYFVVMVFIWLIVREGIASDPDLTPGGRRE